jgi:hypothetical protein
MPAMCSVHDVIEPVAVQTQQTAQQVVENERAEIADMGEIVDRGTAGIHFHGARIDGGEWLHLLSQRIIETQRHEGETFMVTTVVTLSRLCD